MMKRMVFLLAVLGTLLSGCGAPAPGGSASSAPQEGSSAQEELPNTEGENSVPLEEDSEPELSSGRDSIPFTGDQLYAAAYLGFEEMEDLSYYTQRYLDPALSGQRGPAHPLLFPRGILSHHPTVPGHVPGPVQKRHSDRPARPGL